MFWNLLVLLLLLGRLREVGDLASMVRCQTTRLMWHYNLRGLSWTCGCSTMLECVASVWVFILGDASIYCNLAHSALSVVLFVYLLLTTVMSVINFACRFLWLEFLLVLSSGIRGNMMWLQVIFVFKGKNVLFSRYSRMRIVLFTISLILLRRLQNVLNFVSNLLLFDLLLLFWCELFLFLLSIVFLPDLVIDYISLLLEVSHAT